MRNRIRSSALALGLGMTTTLLSGGASAAAFDGTANLICAAIDVVGCANGPGCMEGQARTFEEEEGSEVDDIRSRVPPTPSKIRLKG